MKKIIIITASLLVILMSCSKKHTPQQTIITNNCDSLVEATLKQIQNQPKFIDCEDTAYTSFCDSMTTANVYLAKEISTLTMKVTVKDKVIDSLKQSKPNVYIDKSRHKTKNSNNNTEVTKLRNAIQIVNSQLDSVSFKNIALNGKVKELEKELTKNKNSTTGNQSPNKSGNVTKSNGFWYGVLVGALGLTLIIVGFKGLKSYLNPLSIII